MMAGEVTIEESNHNASKKSRRRGSPGNRNPRSPSEFTHQIKVPLWMDGPYINRCIAEWGCDRADALARIRRESGS